MKSSKNTPHLDPLPSSDEGRGNPRAHVSRTRAWVTESDRIFHLPCTRGEDQGEGLIRRPLVSLTKWPCRRPALRFRGAKRVRRTGHSHLDPLPSSDEARGNPISPVSRASAWVTERYGVFPLPFTRGEDQGEGLIRRPFVSLTKWQCPSTERGKRHIRLHSAILIILS